MTAFNSLAMERESERGNRHLIQKPKLTRKKLDDQRKANLDNIIKLYDDQIDHHEYMVEVIRKQEMAINNKQEGWEEHFWDMFGVSTDILRHSEVGDSTVEGAIPLAEAVQRIVSNHELCGQIYRSAVSSRRYTAATFVLDHVAALYHGALCNSLDAWERVDETIEKFKGDKLIENIDNYYWVKIQKDKALFYERVIEKILECFWSESDRHRIYSKLIDLSKVAIKNQQYVQDDMMKMSLKNVNLCQDIIKGIYQFPSPKSQEEEVVISNDEEEKLISSQVKIDDEKLRKKREKRKRQRQRLKEKKILLGLEKKKEEKLTEIKEEILGEQAPGVAIKDVDSSQTVEVDGTKHVLDDSKTPKNKEMKQENFMDDMEIRRPSLEDGRTGETSSSDSLQTEMFENEEIIKAQWEKNHEEKKNRNKKKSMPLPQKISLNPVIKKQDVGIIKIKNKKHTLFLRFFEEPKDLNIRWDNLKDFLKNTFKGKVYGTKNGSSNTFEVYLKFYKGTLLSFLSASDFQDLKKKAEPELWKNRAYLPDNKRLEGYKVDEDVSIGGYFFTLHNPHPYPCLYPDLISRLRMHLALLGITPDTIKSM